MKPSISERNVSVTYSVRVGQIDLVEKMSEKLGISRSAVVRKAIDELYTKLGIVTDTEDEDDSDV